MNLALGQSVTLQPGTNGFVAIPIVNSLSTCSVAEKGNIKYLSSDNQFYTCNGSIWSIIGTIALPFQSSSPTFTGYDGGTFKITNTNPTGEGVAINATYTGIDGFALRAIATNTNPSSVSGAIYASNESENSNGYGINGSHSGGGIGVEGYSYSGKAGSFFSFIGTAGYFSSNSGHALVTGSGKVGIGLNPLAKLHVGGTEAEKLRLENTTALASNVSNELYFKTGDYFTGGIKTIGTGSGYARMSLFTFTSNDSGDLLERMSISDNGYVGIGNSSPNAPLQFSNNLRNRKLVVYEAVNNDHQYIGIGLNSGIFRYQVDGTSSNHVFYAAASSSASNELMRISGTGNVGIGKNNPTASLHVARGTGGDGTAAFSGTTHASHFSYSTTEHTFIRGGKDGANVYINDVGTLGNVAIGNGTPTEKLHVFGNLRVSGTICNTSGAITACSDVRYKKNFSKIENPLSKVLALNGLHYDWRIDEFKDNNFSKSRQIGFIAQELEEIFPEMVFTDEKGYKSVDYAKLTPVLVEAMKEQQKMIEELRKANGDLKNINDKLESRMDKIESILNK